MCSLHRIGHSVPRLRLEPCALGLVVGLIIACGGGGEGAPDASTTQAAGTIEDGFADFAVGPSAEARERLSVSGSAREVPRIETRGR
jgi:hypothetical protein